VIDLSSVQGDVRVLGDNEDDKINCSDEMGGDFNRDGFADFVISAVAGDNPSIGGNNQSGVAYLIYGDGIAMSATVSQFSRTGDGAGGDIVPPTDFGPVARCVVDFSDDDSGFGNASMTTVTLTRSGSGPSSTSITQMAGVRWEILTNRTGWASAEVTVKYIDAEISETAEDSLLLFQGPTTVGPWTLVQDHWRNTHRNLVGGTVMEMGHFALAWRDPTAQSTADIINYLLGFTDDPTGLNINGDDVVDTADAVLSINIGGEGW
jgi:hypothetical protein